MLDPFMQRCLDLAELGLGKVAPNPTVGAVLVHQQRIIGEGYHQQYGQAHAEVNAIASVSPTDAHLIPQSTLYVSLEPCSHYGKTPPCADLIIRHGIRQVVIACPDPFKQVDGRGIARLQAAGIAVQVGVMQAAAEWQLRRFLTVQRRQRPYIILKWAQTADAYFAPNSPQQQWISNAAAQLLSHRWRTQEQAIMVGTNTALTDNPQLNPRLWAGKQPLRVVVDRRGILSASLHLLTDGLPTLVFVEQQQHTYPAHIQQQRISFDSPALALRQMMERLQQQHIQSVIIEGGAALLGSFIAHGLWDEARIFTAPQRWQQGIPAPQLTHAQHHQRVDLLDNRLDIWVKKSNT